MKHEEKLKCLKIAFYVNGVIFIVGVPAMIWRFI